MIVISTIIFMIICVMSGTLIIHNSQIRDTINNRVNKFNNRYNLIDNQQSDYKKGDIAVNKKLVDIITILSLTSQKEQKKLNDNLSLLDVNKELWKLTIISAKTIIFYSGIILGALIMTKKMLLGGIIILSSIIISVNCLKIADYIANRIRYTIIPHVGEFGILLRTLIMCGESVDNAFLVCAKKFSDVCPQLSKELHKFVYTYRSNRLLALDNFKNEIQHDTITQICNVIKQNMKTGGSISKELKISLEQNYQFQKDAVETKARTLKEKLNSIYMFTFIPVIMVIMYADLHIHVQAIGQLQDMAAIAKQKSEKSKTTNGAKNEEVHKQK